MRQLSMQDLEAVVGGKSGGGKGGSAGGKGNGGGSGSSGGGSACGTTGSSSTTICDATRCVTVTIEVKCKK